jgi:hypothetical protein
MESVGAQSVGLWRVNTPERNMAQVVRRGLRAMGRVSVSKQWLGVAAGVLLSSAFAVFLGWFIGWSQSPLLIRYDNLNRIGKHNFNCFTRPFGFRCR